MENSSQEEEKENLGFVELQEGQKGRGGTGKVYVYDGIEFHAKTKWLADTYQVIPQHMRSTRNQQYKSEKKRLHRMINTYDKNKVQDFISGATKLYHQRHLID